MFRAVLMALPVQSLSLYESDQKTAKKLLSLLKTDQYPPSEFLASINIKLRSLGELLITIIYIIIRLGVL